MSKEYYKVMDIMAERAANFDPKEATVFTSDMSKEEIDNKFTALVKKVRVSPVLKLIRARHKKDV